MWALRGSMAFVVAFLLVLTVSAPVSAAADVVEERTCTVTGVIGSVQVRYSPDYKKMRREKAVAKGFAARVSGSITDEWSDLRQNMVVGEKCEIKTGPESEVRLETVDGTVLRVEENALVEVAVLQAVTKKSKVKGGGLETTVSAKFKLFYGNLIGNVKKVTSEKPEVKFETPTATAAIRGTVIEVDVGRNTNTLIRAFDGTIQVAPIKKPKKLVDVGDWKMVEIVPNQTALVVRDVPKWYKRKAFRLKGEKDAAAPIKESRLSEKPKEPVVMKLRLDLGDIPDTISCYAGDTVVLDGVIAPVGAKVSMNGVSVAVGKGGAFRAAVPVPDSGIFPLNIVAESETEAESVVRTLRVGHVHTAVRLITPVEGDVVKKPAVLVSGTAEPGSKVSVLGVTINVNRDGTFSGEVNLPPREGTVKVQVEIVNKNDDAVWIERNIRYKKK